MDLRISNIQDLQSEISRLEALKVEQHTALAARFDGPGAIFNTVLSLFPKSAATDAIKGQDLLGLLSRFLLPLALNKTVFSKSNFLIKTLVGIASQKASHFISEDAVSGVWGKVTSLFNKFTKKDKPSKPKVKDLTELGVEPE